VHWPCRGTLAQGSTARCHVFSVYDEARGIDDDEVIKRAFAENRVLVTNDKDFGEKVYRERLPHRGAILLRLADERSVTKIDVLQRLLSAYADHIPGQFVVVTETKIRFARMNLAKYT
jgi:predicted nuclease of predicted toxin-antitoxin system